MGVGHATHVDLVNLFSSFAGVVFVDVALTACTFLRSAHGCFNVLFYFHGDDVTEP